ncbi:hypothetical protein BUALT_Bualt10G0004500 [Buddleja alternifolia]|uniref:BHLH domain-containing protein n=1 Tax=Buddleja alternifolia TaxID=168488 RepID=A0AAV6X5N6_9LAMI|nr:hypothetical protein BUALT_Bualt10G0004500 [Buddleja alternifolia]
MVLQTICPKLDLSDILFAIISTTKDPVACTTICGIWVEANSDKAAEQPAKPAEPSNQDYIHVRARRGQATDGHSLAERARREKISERMKILQDLVPGCNKRIYRLFEINSELLISSRNISSYSRGTGSIMFNSCFINKLKQVEEFVVSSCLTLPCSINGCSTSEILGNSKNGFHLINQKFAGIHASQCSFCIPDFLAYVCHSISSPPCSKHTPLCSKMIDSEAEKAIMGNLCRCTGYRQSDESAFGGC